MKLEVYKPEKAMVALKECRTPAACLSSSTPALSVLRKKNGEEAVLAALEAWILDMNEFVNVQRTMGPAQIKQTAVMILSDFYYFKIADINLVFTRAKKGYFGDLYGSLDGMKIYRWFVDYDIERSQTAYMDNLKDHDITKSDEMRR